MAFKTDVRSELGEWNYHALADGSIRFQKQLKQNKKMEVVEAIGTYWLFGFITLRNGLIEYPQKGAEPIQFSNHSWAVFFASGSFAKSVAIKPDMVAEGFCSPVVLPTSMPTEPIVMPILPNVAFPNSVAEVIQYLEKTKKQHRNISFCQKPSTIASRGRKLIESSLQTERSLAEIAKQLRTTPAQFSRAFKADYEMTPVQYKNHLRVRMSVFKLLTDEAPIISVGETAGFQDHGRFYKAVKKHTKLTPGAFRKRKKA